MTGNSFDIIESRTLRDRVTERIQSAIIHGELPSGMRLRETQLAQDLGVSRGPVREALQELALTGYVTNIPYRGSYVTSLSVEEIRHVYSLRGVLEGYAAATGLTMIREQLLPSIEAAFSNLLQAVEHEQIRDIAPLDTGFHREICRAAANGRLERMWETLSGPLQAQFASRIPALYSSVELVSRHEFIVETLRRGSAEEVEQTIRDHYEETARRMTIAVNQSESLNSNHIEDGARSGAAHPKAR